MRADDGGAHLPRAARSGAPHKPARRRCGSSCARRARKRYGLALMRSCIARMTGRGNGIGLPRAARLQFAPPADDPPVHRRRTIATPSAIRENRISSATRRFPPTPTGACTPPARWRTSRSRARRVGDAANWCARWPTSRRRRRAPTPSSACSTRKRAGAIMRACDDLIGGGLHEQFVVDVIQGGAGTSTNMNANEVIANRALETWATRRAATTCCTRTTTSTPRRAPTTCTRPRCALAACGPASTGCWRRWPPARRLRGQGREFKRRAQDRPHAAAGRGADDAGPGVLGLRRDDRRGRSSACARRAR